MSGWMRMFGAAGATLALLAVALGAFGAHALQERLEPGRLEVFETAVRYQFFHALALVLVALVLSRHPGGPAQVAGWGFLAGILVFSGSLYLLVFTGVARWGAVTPVGGVAFLAGWVALLWHFAQG